MSIQYGAPWPDHGGGGELAVRASRDATGLAERRDPMKHARHDGVRLGRGRGTGQGTSLHVNGRECQGRIGKTNEAARG
jgi:hypothetical protein